MLIVDTWNGRETRFILNMFDDHVNQVGVKRQFRNKKDLWRYISTELYEVLGVKRTYEQLQNRYKTVIRKMRKIKGRGQLRIQPREPKEYMNASIEPPTNLSPVPVHSEEEETDIQSANIITPARAPESWIKSITQERESCQKSKTQEPESWQQLAVDNICETLFTIDGRRAAREKRREKERQRRHNEIIELLTSMR